MLALVRQCAPTARAALRTRRIVFDYQSTLLRGFASADTKWGVTNESITARVVNIVEEGGTVRMDVPIRQAIQDAQIQGVDLVQMSPVGKLPTVCRLFDAKKRFYELKKASKKTSKQQKPKPDKEVVIGAKIAPNDLNMKVAQLKRFLNKGHKVKVTIKFKQAYHLKAQSFEQLKQIESRIDVETAADDTTPSATKVPMSKKQVSMGNISEEIEDELSTLPNMQLSQLHFLLQHQHATNSNEDAAAKQQVLDIIRQNDMAPFYRFVCQEFQWPLDTALEVQMSNKNAQELVQLDERLADAEQNLGDIEVLEALLTKARMYSRIGDKEKALDAFAVAGEKPQSINQKILVALHIIRIGLFFSDLELVEQYIKKAAALIDEGGDWDRRNRLKVYEGCYLLMARDFAKASTLFQESVATFTATELMPYNTMVFYCVITCVLSMSRVDLKKKIVDSPEILAVINEIPFLTDFLNGVYDCDYKKFFTAMVDIQPYILRDKYLSTHSRFLYRELRVLVYAQFLEAYRSVTIASMATAFGVSVDFLNTELARFIAAGRLNAKIDKVAGVIETNRPDAKNAQYQDAIKKGDLLLNRIQKLARVINV